MALWLDARDYERVTANVSIPWSDAERRQLRQLRDNGLSMRQIAAHMGRSKNSVSRQMRNMALAANERAPGAVKRPGAHPKAAVIAPLRAGRTTLPRCRRCGWIANECPGNWVRRDKRALSRVGALRCRIRSQQIEDAV